MRRRLTMVTAEEPVPSDYDEPIDDLEEEYLEEEEGDEVEYSEEEEEQEKVVIDKYVPESFEQLNAMYRPKGSEYSKSSGIEELRARMEDIKPKLEEVKPKIEEIKQAIEEIKPKIDNIMPKIDTVFKSEQINRRIEEAGTIPTQLESRNLDVPLYSELTEKHSEDEGEAVEDLSEGEEEEDLLDEEELGSEEEEEEVSEVDDDELMKRLEAKYGKLPQRKYDSEQDDEDIEEDNSWTSN